MASLLSLAAFFKVFSLISAAPFDGEGRIIGGLLAPEHSFPYLVGLSITKSTRSEGIYWCGGSLISPNFILTAAHCVFGDIYEVQVKLGVHKRNSLKPHGNIINIQPKDIIIHEHFNKTITQNDIALIRLPVNVTLTDDIQLIHLASSYMDQEFLQGQEVIAAGWGKIVDNMTGISEVLRYVDVKIMNQDTCDKAYDEGLVTSTNICIDGSEMKGTCKGDSGGPLVYQAADDSRYLVGVTSFGSEHGCTKGFPTVFTRITAYLDWIVEYTNINIDS
ncbi:brachyurin-like [Eupeodes corollae]|uniref:brachyurin-like n=1 Tax=Eupeodes corollae TaxID=290404 RepID=UPI0024925F9B|nr:brachyurin-like [Eupeodes corollae]